MRLDAASTYSVRSLAAQQRSAVSGGARQATSAPAILGTPVDGATDDPDASTQRPPSIDGKGTVIDTYA
jgi:hypothetical protein